MQTKNYKKTKMRIKKAVIGKKREVDIKIDLLSAAAITNSS